MVKLEWPKNGTYSNSGTLLKNKTKLYLWMISIEEEQKTHVKCTEIFITKKYKKNPNWKRCQSKDTYRITIRYDNKRNSLCHVLIQ